PLLTPYRLAYGYEIVGVQGLPWRPLRVFDDGQHVYIQMPAALQASEAPALLVQSRGESALVNYRVRLPYYVVDRLFDTAVLIVGVGRHQDRVTIQRKADAQSRRRETTRALRARPARAAARAGGAAQSPCALCRRRSPRRRWRSPGSARCEPRARGSRWKATRPGPRSSRLPASAGSTRCRTVSRVLRRRAQTRHRRCLRRRTIHRRRRLPGR